MEIADKQNKNQEELQTSKTKNKNLQTSKTKTQEDLQTNKTKNQTTLVATISKGETNEVVVNWSSDGKVEVNATGRKKRARSKDDELLGEY